MKKRKLFPKNSIDNLKINYANIGTRYKFKLPKNMGCLGSKMPCTVFDDFAFHDAKKKSKFRGMSNPPISIDQYAWAKYIKHDFDAMKEQMFLTKILDYPNMPPKGVIPTTPGSETKYCDLWEKIQKHNEKHGVKLDPNMGALTENIPLEDKGKTLEELVSEATGIRIEELNMYPIDIGCSDSSLRRELTPEELKNGIKVNYTFNKSHDTEKKSEESILPCNGMPSTQSFDDMQEEWLQRIAAECGIPKHMLQQVYENTDGWKYIFHSKVIPLFWINVGKTGNYAHKAVDDIQKLDKSLSKHNDLNNVRIIYRLYKEFIKWVEDVYGDYVSMPERIKELWMWLRYRLHQCKLELNSNYGFSRANSPHGAGWHIDARLGGNLDPFKKQYDVFRGLLRDTMKGAAPKGEPPMPEQKDQSESFVAHLPKGCIYELLGQEEIDHDKSEVIRDARGKITEYKWCKKEINTSNARGIVIAYPDDKKKMVMVGMVCCEADEKFDFGKHMIQALQNACDHNYGQDGIYVDHIKAFFSRCRVEFPQLEDADWGVSFYNRGGI